MVDHERKAVQAASFGAVADVYERARPTYPAEAIDWLVPPAARRVVDVGAGTGKLTRGLTGRGIEVVAVEPSAGMREEFARALPGITLMEGTAEDIPVASGTADAVLLAQAWHWVDPARAVPEVARVLVPGGRLGLVWNIRDSRVDWVAKLTRIIYGADNRRDDDQGIAPQVGPPFGPVERFDVEWSMPSGPAEILDLVTSRSYIITMPTPERSAVLAQVQHLLDTHPDLAGATEISIPYVTRCSRAQLPG
jgi:SAM-dependent methyltransferase